MLGGIVIYGLVYQFYVKWFDKHVIQVDPTRPTPAHTYMDGVEFFPSNKYVMLGWHWKSIAALGPVTGPALAIVWGWLPGFLWILIGNSLMGWLHDYNAVMSSVRNEGASLGPMTYQLMGSRARKVLVAFLAFYTILVFAAFLGALLPVTTNPLLGGFAAVISFLVMSIVGILSGFAVFKKKINVIAVTLTSLVVIAVSIYLTQVVFGASINSAFVSAFPNTNVQSDVILLTMIVFSFLGAVLPLWAFAMPINYLGFYVAYFVVAAIIGSSFAVPQTFHAPMFTSVFAPLTLGAGQGTFLFTFPLWPLMFVTIACGACSGWHGLIGSSLSSKQLDNESDAHLVGGGSMLLEGILGLTSVVAVGALTINYKLPLAALGLYVKGGAVYLSNLGFSSTTGIAIMSLMVLVLGLTLTQLALRFARLAISEMAGTKVFKNVYVTAIVVSIITYLLVSPRVIPAGLWGFIWALFGGSNQLLAGVTLLVTTLWLAKIKRNTWFTGIPAIFMLVTTIVALGFTAYATFYIGFTAAGAKAYGSAVAGVIGTILTILGIVLAYDGFRAYQSIRMGISVGETSVPPSVGPPVSSSSASLGLESPVDAASASAPPQKG
jgi:carbon starvation protein